MSFFEAGMIFCFGLAWPVNIIKSVRTKSAKGKSLMFLVAVWIGYVSGIIHKITYSRDIVMVLYIINWVLVTADIVLYFINRRRDRLRESNAIIG